MTSRTESKLLIVGDGDLRHFYEAAAQEMGLGDRVLFAGRVPLERLPDYYKATACTILPSTSVEMFGMVLVEAMACGKPTIATDLPGVRTVVDHERTGLLVRPSNPLALASAMDRMLSGDIAREFGLRGRQKVLEKYDRVRMGKELAALYAQIYVDELTR